MANYTWCIEREDWPWNESYGQNAIIVVSLDGKPIMRIAACEVIESIEPKFVEAHLKECKKLHKNS